MKKLILAIAIIASHNTFAAVAASTQVATSEGQVDVERLIPGDNVLTAKEGSVPTKIQKISSELVFVNGAELQGQNVMKVSYGERQSLIMTLDQSIMTENGKLIEARFLTLKNSLIDSEGNLVRINSIEMGRYEGRIVEISPDSMFVTENLYLANGIWVGSFRLSMHVSTGKEVKAFIYQTF